MTKLKIIKNVNMVMVIALLLLTSLISFGVGKRYGVVESNKLTAAVGKSIVVSSTSPIPTLETKKDTETATVTYLTPTPMKPSEKALKIAALSYAYSSDDIKKIYIQKYSASGNKEEAIMNVALELDSNPTKMAEVEANLTKIMSQSTYKNCIVDFIGGLMHITGCY